MFWAHSFGYTNEGIPIYNDTTQVSYQHLMQQLNKYTLLIPNFNDTFLFLFELPSES